MLMLDEHNVCEMKCATFVDLYNCIKHLFYPSHRYQQNAHMEGFFPNQSLFNVDYKYGNFWH